MGMGKLVVYSFRATQGNAAPKPQNLLRISVTENTRLTDSGSGLFGVLYQPSQGGLALSRRPRLSSRPQLSAIELLASFIVDSGGGVLICVRWPLDDGDALVIFSDKKVRAGPEYAVPLLGLCEESVRTQSELHRHREARLSGGTGATPF
jgi:hypothetical protein